MLDSKTEPGVQAEPGVRRPYVAPQLAVHGTVSALTAKLGSSSDGDAGSFTPPDADARPSG